VHVEHLWLRDFRSYETVDLELTDGVCAVLGPNGVGKSNLLEAVAYLGELESFRGAPTAALIRSGADAAVVRGTVRHDDREQLIEAELAVSGRNRVLVNRQRLVRSRDLLGAVTRHPAMLRYLDNERNAAGSTAMSAPGANALASPRRAPPTQASAAAKDSDNGASGATCWSRRSLWTITRPWHFCPSFTAASLA
jgi:energy-coupling factor transporter ATP-binding protein EcfA2